MSDHEWQYYGEREAPEAMRRNGNTLALCRAASGHWSVRRRDPETGGVSGTTYGEEAEALAHWEDVTKRPPCKECGEVEPFEWEKNSAAQLAERGLCFHCNVWTNTLEWVAEPKAAIIDGYLYSIQPESDNSSFRGHGGARFVIQFDDGREVTTTNLWAAGKIPAHFRERIRDNARFSSREFSCAYVGHGSASV